MGAVGAVKAGAATVYVAPGYTAAVTATAFIGKQVIQSFHSHQSVRQPSGANED